MTGMKDRAQAAYWSHLPGTLPWRYKLRKALHGGYVLQVSGPLAGARHRTVLLKLQPGGWLKAVWKSRLILASGVDPRAAALDRMIASLENHTDPYIKDMLADARAARYALYAED